MAIHPGTTSTSLLLRLKHDDAEAWERFDSFYLPLVRRWCQRLQPADREEIAQQCAERVHAAIGRFERKRHGSFRAWLRAIVENLIKDFYRDKVKTKPTMTDEMLAGVTRPTEAELDEENRLLYKRAVGIMRRDFREESVRCFEGIVIHSLLARELAEELGMTINAVRTAKGRIPNGSERSSARCLMIDQIASEFSSSFFSSSALAASASAFSFSPNWL